MGLDCECWNPGRGGSGHSSGGGVDQGVEQGLGLWVRRWRWRWRWRRECEGDDAHLPLGNGNQQFRLCSRLAQVRLNPAWLESCAALSCDKRARRSVDLL